ncbi:MAG: serine acetyltransferase [Oscillospiraceae bacterium]|nr:serine acetyltransferase [Oscillospiraceae bacterium]
MWCRYLNPELNAVYLIRRKQFLESRGRLGKLFSRFCHVVLMRRYGIHITQGTVIGKGLRIAHPTSIVVTHCEIGENFTIYQNCTIGQKKWKSGEYPTLGNHVTMYAGSCIIGAVKVADDVVLGANSILLQDADQAGVYVGTPARRIEG